MCVCVRVCVCVCACARVCVCVCDGQVDYLRNAVYGSECDFFAVVM